MEDREPLTPSPFLLVGERETPPRPWTVERIGLKVEDLAGRVDELAGTQRVTRREVGEIRTFLLDQGGLNQRVGAVEVGQKTAVQKVGAGAGTATKWIAYVTLAATAGTQVAAAFSPKLVGPLQTILQMLQGLGQ